MVDSLSPINSQMVAGLAIRKGFFLGSPNRMILSGNSLGGSSGVVAAVRVLYDDTMHGAGIDIADISFDGRTSTDMELCGILRSAQTVAAISLYSERSQRSTIELVNLQTSVHSASLSLMDSTLFDCTSIGTATSMSYQSEYEILSVGTDAGFVVLIDLFTGREVVRLKTDPCGVTKVKFNRAGQLVTCGSSAKNQIKLWDIREHHRDDPLGGGSTGSSCMSLSQQLSHSNSRRSSSAAYKNCFLGTTRVTAIATHPMQEKLVSGTGGGAVCLWDLRSGGKIDFAAHGQSITDILVHPARSDMVLSSSCDRTVRMVDTNSVSTANSHPSLCPVLYRDVSTIRSLACDCSTSSFSDASCTLLAAADAGGVTRLVI